MIKQREISVTKIWVSTSVNFDLVIVLGVSEANSCL